MTRNSWADRKRTLSQREKKAVLRVTGRNRFPPSEQRFFTVETPLQTCFQYLYIWCCNHVNPILPRTVNPLKHPCNLAIKVTSNCWADRKRTLSQWEKKVLLRVTSDWRFHTPRHPHPYGSNTLRYIQIQIKKTSQIHSRLQVFYFLTIRKKYLIYLQFQKKRF